MSTEETYRKLLEDLRNDRAEIERDLLRLAEAYNEKMVEYRKVSHGINGIEDEIRKLKGRIE